MLPLSVRTIRLTLHVLGVTVWVGGQITLLGLLPAVRSAGGDLGRQIGRQFNRVAWPAFGLAVLTGLWNIASIDLENTPTDYQVTLFVKLFMVALSGVGAYLHGRATSKAAIAGWGAVGLVSALLAVLFGVQIAGFGA
jgi:putative copper export protein